MLHLDFISGSCNVSLLNYFLSPSGNQIKIEKLIPTSTGRVKNLHMKRFFVLFIKWLYEQLFLYID